MNRMPWAQRPLRGMQPAREVAVAAEAILIRYVGDAVMLDRILNMIELSVHQQLVAVARGAAASSGFDPSTGAPSRSRPDYSHRARTAPEIRQQMQLEQQGRAAVAHHGQATPQTSDMIADPAAALEREAARYQQHMPPPQAYAPPPPPPPQQQQPQPQQQPNGVPHRPDPSAMPWL